MGTSERSQRARALLIVNVPALYHVAQKHGLVFTRDQLKTVIKHFRGQLQGMSSQYKLDVVIFRYNHGEYSMALARQMKSEGVRVHLVDYKQSTIDEEIWDYLVANCHNYTHIALAGGYNVREMGETSQLAEYRDRSWLFLYSFFPEYIPVLALMDFDRVFNLFEVLGCKPRTKTGLKALNSLLARKAC